MKQKTAETIELFLQIYNSSRAYKITRYSVNGPNIIFYFKDGAEKKVALNQVTNTVTWDRARKLLEE